MKENSKLKLLLNMLVTIGILGICLYLLDHSFGKIFAQLLKTNLLTVGIIVGLGVLYQIIEGKSIKEIVCHFQNSFTTWDGLLTSGYIAFYRVITFGTGTLVSEVHFYKKKGLHFSQSVGIMMLHMVMYKLAVIFLASLAVITQFAALYTQSTAMLSFSIIGIFLTLLIVVLLLALSSSIKLHVFFISVADRWFKSTRIRNWVDHYNLQTYSLRETVTLIMQNPATALKIFIWNVAKLIIWYIIPYVALVQAHPTLTIWVAMSMTSIAVVLASVFPTPAGVGPFEFIYLLLFQPLVGTVDAAASLLLYRFASFVLPFLIGSGYLSFSKIRQYHIQRKRKHMGKNLH